MSLAIQWGFPPYSDLNNLPNSQGFIYFDAVTSYKKSFTGAVSKNPIDGGGLISDHFTKENPVITISAVISSVDISIHGVRVSDLDGNTPTNSRPYFESVKNNSTDKSLVNYLPDVIGQFFTPKKPDIVLASQPVATLQNVQDLLESLFLEDKVQLVILYEYTNAQLKKAPMRDLVMVSLAFNETPETGEGLYCDITLEQITYTTTRKTVLPSELRASLVSEDLAKKAEELKSKGKVDSTPRGTVSDRSIIYDPVTKGTRSLADVANNPFGTADTGGSR